MFNQYIMRMKKLLLVACGFALFTLRAIPVWAQAPAYTADVYIAPFSVESGDGMFGTIFGVSSNGEYAVGTDDYTESGGFMWKKETGEFVMIDLADYLNDVSDDGTVVGSFYIEVDGMETSVPGYYKDGQWTALPLLSNRIYSSNMNGMAVAISADGRYIAGWVASPEGFIYVPIVWENGVIKDTFDNLNVMGQGWVVKGMSDDGSIVTGLAEWESGARSSAVIIDGEEIRLTCLSDPLDTADEDVWIDAEGHAKVSANGKYFAGYCAESANGTGLQGWYWNPVVSDDTKGLVFLDANSMCLCVDNQGVIYGCDGLFGAACQYKDGVKSDLADLYDLHFEEDVMLSAVQDCSDDGRVLGGLAVAYKNGEMAYFPYVIVLRENGEGAVNSTKEKINTVMMRGNTLYVGGQYQAVRVYDTSGFCIANENSGSGTIALSAVPKGVYLVKVINGDIVNTFKVVR